MPVAYVEVDPNRSAVACDKIEATFRASLATVVGLSAEHRHVILIDPAPDSRALQDACYGHFRGKLRGSFVEPVIPGNPHLVGESSIRRRF